MQITTVLLSVGMLVVSFLGAIIFYYMIDTEEKNNKRFQLEQMLNVIIQFVLYLWAAKVVFKLDIFIHDPLTVLAYPSNSTHFFIASVALVVHLVIKYRKDQPAAAALFQTGSFVFLAALLLYDFFEMIGGASVHLDATTIILTVLVVVYVLCYSKFSEYLLGSLLTGVFLVVAGGIAFYKGYFMLFGYMLGPSYYFLLVILLLLYSYRMYKNKFFV